MTDNICRWFVLRPISGKLVGKAGLTAALVILMTGCSSIMTGYIFTHTVHPYSTDFNNTPVGTRKCIIANYQVREPISGYGASAEWNMRTISQAARDAGITNLYYADIHTLSLFRRIYRRKALVLYGD